MLSSSRVRAWRFVIDGRGTSRHHDFPTRVNSLAAIRYCRLPALPRAPPRIKIATRIFYSFFLLFTSLTPIPSTPPALNALGCFVSNQVHASDGVDRFPHESGSVVLVRHLLHRCYRILCRF